MNNNDIYDNIHKAKEIYDIQSECHKIEELLKNQKWDELDKYLKQLQSKYFIETAIHNLTHPNPPKNIQQNAENCIAFLKNLEVAKATKNALEDEHNRK